jgi:hypothetical protein
MKVLGIDPGTVMSGYCLLDEDGRPEQFDKVANSTLRQLMLDYACLDAKLVAIESMVSYGQVVGDEVFETCVWIGRFAEIAWTTGGEPMMVKRRTVKQHIANDAKANDAGIRAALLDRFGGLEAAKGRKAAPGPLYGLSGDMWSALAIALTARETFERAPWKV